MYSETTYHSHGFFEAESQDADDLFGLDSADDFDLDNFFDEDIDEEIEDSVETELVKEQKAGKEITENKKDNTLLLSLRDESDEIITTYTTKISADAFNKSSAFVSSAASLFGSLIGSCGPICFHSPSSLANASPGISAATSMGGLGNIEMPGFNIDKNGNFQLDGNIHSLSKLTGFSQKDLLSGNISADDIFASLFASFGEGISIAFGFGYIHSFIDMLFSSFGQTANAA